LVISLSALIIGLITSGILLSFDRGYNNRILRAHNITTILGIIVSTITIYLLGGTSL